MSNNIGKMQGAQAPAEKVTHSVDFLKRLADWIARLSEIRAGVVELERGVVGSEAPPPTKEKLKEVYPDTVVGNQERLLADLADEIIIIDASVRHLRSYA